MKKQLIISAASIAAIVLVSTSVKAQAPATATPTATMTITLADVISIDPTSKAITDGNALFNYATESDYVDGVAAVTKTNNLIITSTKAFDVKVTADAEFTGISDDAINATIDIDVLKIKVKPSSTAIGTVDATGLELDGTTQTLISNAALGQLLKVDVDYIIPAAKSKSTQILGKPAGNYTADIVYSVTAH